MPATRWDDNRLKRSSLNELLTPVLEHPPAIAVENEVEVLRELPVETVYLALKSADAETALWFFENARPEQVQGIIDIDCWDGADFQIERYEEVFKTLTLLSPLKIGEYMKQLDPEIIVRGILDFCDVLDFDPQNPPDHVEEGQFLLTLDSKYFLHLKKNDPNLKEALFQWLNKFSAADIELLRRHLESAKWEVPSDLEEFAYQVKKGRLEEMGFVDYQEAIELYSVGQAASLKKQMLDDPLDVDTKFPKELLPSDDDSDLENPSLLPRPVSGKVWETGFIRDCLNQIPETERKRILLMELLRTVNAALAADRALHEDMPTIERVSQRSRKYIEIGLLYLSEGDATRGSQMMMRQPLAEVFRLGWLTVQDLSKAAADLKKNFGTAVFGSPDDRLLDALSGVRHPEIDETLLKDLSVKEFPSFEGVLRIGVRLAELAAVALYAWTELDAAMSFKSRPLTDGESLYSRFLTFVVRQSTGGQGGSQAITPDEWTTMAPKIDWAAVEKAVQIVTERAPERARALLQRRLKDLVSDAQFYLKQNASKFPDPRFFKALNFAKTST